MDKLLSVGFIALIKEASWLLPIVIVSKNNNNVATLASSLQPRQRLVKVRAKSEAWESHFMLSGVWENVKEWTSTLPNELPLWELESWWNPQNPLDYGVPYIIEKILEPKMGLHDPFGWFKHKLWPKEGSGVKLPIWPPTTKSLKSPWFPCVQVACDIPLESSWQGLQHFFRDHLNWRSAHKIMGLQSCKSLNFWEFSRQNDIWMLVSWPCTKYIIRGKVVASPKFGLWWVLCIRVCLLFVCAPKVF